MNDFVKCLALALLCSSCLLDDGSSGSNKNKSTEPLNSSDQLQGTFVSGCIDEEGGSFQDKFTFAGEELEIEVRNYSASGCPQAKLVERFRSSYLQSFNGKKLQLIKQKYYYTLFDSNHLAQTNLGQGFCGFNHWVVNDEREITGSDCDGETFINGDQFSVPALIKNSSLTINGNKYTRQ